MWRLRDRIAGAPHDTSPMLVGLEDQDIRGSLTENALIACQGGRTRHGGSGKRVR